MEEEIPLTGLGTDQLLVRTITTLNFLAKEVTKMSKAFGEAEDLHWKCPLYPGRDGVGAKLVKDVEEIKVEIATTKAYIGGVKRGLWMAIVILAVMNLIQLPSSVPNILTLIKP